MGEIAGKTHLRIIEGRPWKQALICALNPQAPYSPWFGTDDVHRGDLTVVVLDTAPRRVLCAFEQTASGDLRQTIAEKTPNVTELLRPVPSVETAAGVRLDDGPITGDSAAALLREITQYGTSEPTERAGDSPVAVGRILLHASGRCTACYATVVITTEDELDRLVHTAYGADVMTGTDWPALLCGGCEVAMRDGGFTSVVDFVFSRHPACPLCSAQGTCEITYGRMGYDGSINMAPWRRSGGCVVDSAQRWVCRECGNGWGRRA